MPGREVAYVGRNVILEYEGSMRGFREIALGPELLASCMALATGKALPYAIQISPVDSGEYKRSWKVFPGLFHTEEGGPSTIRTRVAALVVNTSDHSALVEWGGSRDGGRRHLAQHICREVVNHLMNPATIDPDLAG